MSAADAAELAERGLHPSGVHEMGRRLLGVPGDGDAPPFAGTVDRAGLRALAGIAAAGGAALLLPYALAPLAGPVGHALGAGAGLVRGGLVLFLLVSGAAAIAVPAFTGARPRRDGVALAAELGLLVVSFAAAFARTGGMLLLLLLAAGLATGAGAAVHVPLLVDRFAAEVRQRVAALHAAVGLGAAGAAMALGATAVAGGAGWRTVPLAAALVAGAAAVLAAPLRDPGFGRHDTDRLHAAVREGMGMGGEDGAAGQLGPNLAYGETLRRVLLVPPVRTGLGAAAVSGMFALPLHLTLLGHLEAAWRVGPAGRAVLLGVMLLAAGAGVVALAERGEALFRRSPSAHAGRLAALLVAGALALGLGALLPTPVLGVPLLFAGLAATAAVLPALTVALLTVVPAAMRGHAAGVLAAMSAAAGGVAGVLLLGALGSRFGTGVAVAGLVVPALAGAAALRRVGPQLETELDRRVDEIVEIEDLRRVRATGGHVPLLSCRHIDFSYGLLQILFDVSFTVDEGEMVALLGTNGAGKSTLLRVISGLGLPSAGTVRLQGEDVTYLDAERRVGMGIAQVPGGKATFGPLSVVDNLRVFGHSAGRRRDRVDQGIEATFAAFPRLAERRNQLAATLSGGEQQMLALGKALILQPRLLLIDELSLGLAPKVVGELLAMVRGINQTGTAVVLVEQSVNVALSLVEHAYFMEKGQMRFDGPAGELLERPELLRSVFLQGAAQGAPALDSAGTGQDSRQDRETVTGP
ncbi:MAG TPA: ABC transporter ATP-binding protein [Egibacteraceae bacterium]|nr:ABC transporter ATP-binding protein [Egibacteraceae bacterium]